MDHRSKQKKILKPLRDQDKTLPLAEVVDQTWHQVMSVQCDYDRRDDLSDLGVIAGTKLQVLHNDHKGTLMLKINQEMVILGRNYSYRTFVSPLRKA